MVYLRKERGSPVVYYDGTLLGRQSGEFAFLGLDAPQDMLSFSFVAYAGSRGAYFSGSVHKPY